MQFEVEKRYQNYAQRRVRLRTYTGHKVQVLGAAMVKVQKKNTTQNLPVVVVIGTGPSLVGRGWIKKLGLQWRPEPKIYQIREETLEEVLGDNKEVFKEELGRFKVFF